MKPLNKQEIEFRMKTFIEDAALAKESLSLTSEQKAFLIEDYMFEAKVLATSIPQAVGIEFSNGYRYARNIIEDRLEQASRKVLKDKL